MGTSSNLKKKTATSKPPPPAKKAKKNPAEPDKLPGDVTYPLNSFSLTITKTGGDIAVELLDILDSFIRNHCTKGTINYNALCIAFIYSNVFALFLSGGVATEVGKRVFSFSSAGSF